MIESISAPAQPKQVTIHTDGACVGNPGPGGYGAVVQYKSHRREFSAGYRSTTNNRMEMMAVIVALEALKEPCDVTLYSDSQYIVKAISEGWARKWRDNGWKRNKKEPALNPDLWDRIITLCEIHAVEPIWVKGHAGVKENERCDRLAVEAAKTAAVLVDEQYEAASNDGPDDRQSDMRFVNVE